MERTRNAIIASFEQLLDEKPFNKITVKEIVERCQINRNTFYYHFRDIPSLLRQVLEQKADELIDTRYEPQSAISYIEPILRYGLEHKRAILHIYRYIPRETFLPYLDRSVRYAVDRYFTAKCQGLSVSQEDVACLAHYYKCALVGLLLDWADAGMSEDALEGFKPVYRLLAGTEDTAFERCLR